MEQEIMQNANFEWLATLFVGIFSAFAGYYSYAKNYVKGFGIPVLSSKQRVSLLSLQEQNAINGYVEGLYNMTHTINKCQI